MPGMEYAEQIMDFRREVMEAGDESAFAGCSWLEDFDNAPAWLDFLKQERNPQTAAGVPADT